MKIFTTTESWSVPNIKAIATVFQNNKNRVVFGTPIFLSKKEHKHLENYEAAAHSTDKL